MCDEIKTASAEPSAPIGQGYVDPNRPNQSGLPKPSSPKYGVLAGEPEILGERCADGGRCHHMCKTECFRKDGCVPLSDSGLNDDWSVPSELDVRLVSFAEDMSTCTLTKGDGIGYFYDRVDAEPSTPVELCSTCNGYGKYQDGDSGTDEDGRCPNIVDCDCDDSERMPQYRVSAPVEIDELKPCPFCGCQVTFLTGREDYRIAGHHAKTCPFLDVDLVVDSRDAWQARAALERKPS